MSFQVFEHALEHVRSIVLEERRPMSLQMRNVGVLAHHIGDLDLLKEMLLQCLLLYHPSLSLSIWLQESLHSRVLLWDYLSNILKLDVEELKDFLEFAQLQILIDR